MNGFFDFFFEHLPVSIRIVFLTRCVRCNMFYYFNLVAHQIVNAITRTSKIFYYFYVVFNVCIAVIGTRVRNRSVS